MLFFKANSIENDVIVRNLVNKIKNSCIMYALENYKYSQLMVLLFVVKYSHLHVY